MTKDLVRDIIFVWFNILMLGMIALMVLGMAAAWTLRIWRKALKEPKDDR